jgi:hypothetical protein
MRRTVLGCGTMLAFAGVADITVLWDSTAS